MTIAMVSTGTASAAGKPTATLIDVHEVKPAKAKPGGAANCSNDNPAAYTGTFASTGWAVEGPTDAHLNTSTVPSSLGSVTAALQSAYDAWAGSGVPAYTVKTDGSVTRPTANRQDDLMFRKGGSSIAVTYTWRWTDGLVESDVQFNSGLSWFQAAIEDDGCIETAGAKYDVQNIAAHEMGHVYGLDHPSGARYETMYAFGYTGETLKRSPATGDRNGMVAIY